MDGWFTPSLIGTLTPGGLLLLTVLLIAMGKLVPKATFDTMRTDRDASIARIMKDRDDRLDEIRSQCTDWKEAYRLSEGARQLQAQMLAEMTEVTRTANSLIRTLRAVIEDGAEPDDDSADRPV